ncbi:unnamed protein product, partial [Closterium sp. Naga37s-1]
IALSARQSCDLSSSTAFCRSAITFQDSRLTLGSPHKPSLQWPCCFQGWCSASFSARPSLSSHSSASIHFTKMPGVPSWQG